MKFDLVDKPRSFALSSSGESSISTLEMRSIVEKLRHQRNRESTKNNYYGIWKHFNQFFIKLDIKPNTWEERIVLFVGYLINKGRKSTTVRSYISALRAVLKEDGQVLNEDVFLLNSLTRACKITNDRVKTRLPIKKGLLCLMIDKLENSFYKSPQPYLVILYKAILSTAYFGLFRLGEVTKSEHVMKAKDVHIGRNKKKLMFVLHSSKTHTLGMKPQIIKISSTDANSDELSNRESPYCPFKILKEFVMVREPWKKEDEQFFVFQDRSPVLPEHIRKIMRKLLILIGLNPQLYSATSLRSGRATTLMELGLEIKTIQKLGRWKSNAIYTYLRT